jgi:hypothetical protein
LKEKLERESTILINYVKRKIKNNLFDFVVVL